MASSGPDILPGFGKVSGDYLRSFPGPPVLQGTGAALTNTGTESALRINRDNFAASLELAKASLGAKADLTEREMINEQSQWELNKRIEYDKQLKLRELIAGIWNTPTTRKAGDTQELGQQYLQQQTVTPPLSKEELTSSLRTKYVESLLNDAATVNKQVEVE